MRAPSEPDELRVDDATPEPGDPVPEAEDLTGRAPTDEMAIVDLATDSTDGTGPSRRSAAPEWVGMAQGALTLTVVVGAAVFVLAQLQPDLILTDTKAAGGDMGAHTWAPAFMRDYLLPHGRLSGWSPDWYAGFPAMQFYMVLPMLAIVALSTILPYGVAFKLVTVAGIVTLPVSAYVFGRMTRQPFPVPAFLALAATTFVFDRSFSIYGGNAASTLAGEFAFSISLSLALLTLGVFSRGMAEGRYRGLAALLLALTALAHLIPTFFAIAGIGVIVLARVGRDLYEAMGSLDDDRWPLFWASAKARAHWLITVAPVSFLLAAFWVMPFYLKQRYLNDMGWGKDEKYTDFLFWREQLGSGGLADYPTLTWVIALALLGVVLSIALRNPGGVMFIGTALIAAMAFRYLPQGRLWNTRVLPFWYLSLLCLGAIGLGLVPKMLGRARLRRGVGLAALASALLLQLSLVVESAIFPVPEGNADWLAVWGDRLEPYVLVAMGVATLVAGAELVDLPSRSRRRAGWILTGVTAAMVLALRLEPDTRTPTRLFGWTCCFLALVATVAITDLVDASSRDHHRPAWISPVLRLGGSVLVLGSLWIYLALPLHSLGWFGKSEGVEYSLLGIDQFSTNDDSFVDSWAAWNYRGYEATCVDNDPNNCGRGRKPYWPEYHAVVTTMTRVGEEHGCGRAMWEYSPDLDRYGTPMALMLLPHWTDGCIGSMEGLYFEASTTTPYHFINQDELSENGSNAQRGMPYGPGSPSVEDFEQGIKHLQMLGVKYYMTYTPMLTGYARDHEDLTEIATSPAVCLPENCPEGVDPPERWVIFEVADSELVSPLTNEPVVLEGVGAGHTCESATIEEDPRGRICEGWLDPAVDWYVDEALWDVPLAESGPEAWDRVSVDEWMETHESPRTPVDPVQVSDISSDDDEISFSVDQIGVPVLVKTSYFPNWKVEGADGPYRVTPNLMVVIPTSEDVRLYYGWIGIDYLAWALTFVGIACLVVVWRRPPIVMPAGPVAVWHRRKATPLASAEMAEPAEMVERAEPEEMAEPAEMAGPEALREVATIEDAVDGPALEGPALDDPAPPES